MDVLYYVFAAAALVAGALASIAIWAPRPTRVRMLALFTTVLFLPLVYLLSVEVLSKPKPVSFEWYERGADGAELLSATFDEGRAIYLWLRLEGSAEPRAYVVPWNVKLAEKLEDAVDEAVRRDSTVQLKKPFYRRSFEEWGDLNVEVIPPPMPPQKNPPVEPKVFNPREKRI
mgnify:CR=1 FL=1|jgi:hypothetical protein